MSDQRNMIIAIALSVLVLLGFQYFYEAPRIGDEQQRIQQQQGEQLAQSSPDGTAPAPDGAAPAASDGAGEASQIPGQAPIVDPAIPSLTAAHARVSQLAQREAALGKVARAPIVNPRLKGSLPLIGRRIDDLVLIDYKETLEDDSPSITLFSPVGSTKAYYAAFGWSPAERGVGVPDDETVWKVDGDTLGPDRPLTLTWTNDQGVVFTRRYEVDENYLFTVTQSVRNSSNQEVTLSPWGYVNRAGTPDTLGFYILHEGPIAVLDGILREEDYDDLQEAPDGISQISTGGWIGITDKFWLAALIPDQKSRFTGTLRHYLHKNQDRYQANYLGQATTLPPGERIEVTNRLFAGAKEVKLIDAYEEAHQITLFDRAIDFGWFYYLTKPLFYVIDFFFNLLGNFGLAILLLTVCIKLVFFPLANKAYKSMSKMKALQPEMMRLKERYGDDRQKLNQEMMGLYKKEKVNPASGCLPIVIQIPVFFALYKVLFVTIEMRHAPFYGWIEDLSVQDPTTIFNLFGLIPWSPPHFLMIGIWPLLMGLSMFAQQKLNPQPTDPIQAKVFLFMPIIFTFILAPFPAGLVIYWTWNNLLSIAQQYVIMRRMGVPIGGGKKKT